ncbi:hypothetical protein [Myxococcus xanthus]|uniref:hypothetical protein n=1 Tax=Myxococcus xanthus TaxID=34 RepID=UPI001162759B|nr:hypothetical protein [Myxococcus xanthus]QDE84893.1 hypothetical protein BHS07_26985 [Myxococcus xanthus]
MMLAQANQRREVLDAHRLVEPRLDVVQQRPPLLGAEGAIVAGALDVDVVAQQVKRDALADRPGTPLRPEQIWRGDLAV